LPHVVSARRQIILCAPSEIPTVIVEQHFGSARDLADDYAVMALGAGMRTQGYGQVDVRKKLSL
jgi:ABC-type branched-subunit amino acid transport system ATPase component